MSATEPLIPLISNVLGALQGSSAARLTSTDSAARSTYRSVFFSVLLKGAGQGGKDFAGVIAGH